MEWLAILVFAGILVTFVVLHQVFFRFSFKQLFFFMFFIDLVTFVVMVANKFDVLFSWIFGVSMIVTFLVGVYVFVVFKKFHDKIQNQMKNVGIIEDMLKNILGGNMGADDLFNMGSSRSSKNDDRSDDNIVVMDDVEEEDAKKNKKDPSSFYVGNIIIDDFTDEKDDDENKKK